jgi:hypothetical protein
MTSDLPHYLPMEDAVMGRPIDVPMKRGGLGPVSRREEALGVENTEKTPPLSSTANRTLEIVS